MKETIMLDETEIKTKAEQILCDWLRRNCPGHVPEDIKLELEDE